VGVAYSRNKRVGVAYLRNKLGLRTGLRNLNLRSIFDNSRDIRDILTIF